MGGPGSGPRPGQRNRAGTGRGTYGKAGMQGIRRSTLTRSSGRKVTGKSLRKGANRFIKPRIQNRKKLSQLKNTAKQLKTELGRDVMRGQAAKEKQFPRSRFW